MFDGSKYGGAVFACQEIFHIEKQWLARRVEKGGGAAATLLRNQIFKALCLNEFVH
jgi:hypothetical protein